MELMELQNAMIETFAQQNTKEIFDRMVPMIEKSLTEKFGFVPQVHEIRRAYGEVVQMAQVTHEKFDEVLQVVNMDIPVYLTGKAGTGKNVICQQVAQALGFDFYFTNAVTQEYKLTGFIDANGKYQETQFYKAFTRGGVFFLDEMDASIPEVLVILNAAIANRYFDFPIGKVDAHPNFRVIAAGNTTGLGANNNYTGRFQLDRASLDRFAMINIDYSPAIESAMANGAEDIVKFAHIFRDATEKAGVECLCSYRTINRLAKLEKVIKNDQERVSICLLKGMSEDDVDTLKNTIKKMPNYEPNKDNKYIKAIVNFRYNQH